MKKSLLLIALLAFGLTFGSETKSDYMDLVKDEVSIETPTGQIELQTPSAIIKSEANDHCYEIASEVLEAGLSSGMLINEAYDAAYAVYGTCVALSYM